MGTSQDSPSDPKIAYPLGSHPFDLKASKLGKNKEKRLKKTHVIQINRLPTSNRSLSIVQKSFWSCTHVNSGQNYALYINLHILLNILSKATRNIQESRKFIE